MVNGEGLVLLLPTGLLFWPTTQFGLLQWTCLIIDNINVFYNFTHDRNNKADQVFYVFELIHDTVMQEFQMKDKTHWTHTNETIPKSLLSIRTIFKELHIYSSIISILVKMFIGPMVLTSYHIQLNSSKLDPTNPLWAIQTFLSFLSWRSSKA